MFVCLKSLERVTFLIYIKKCFVVTFFYVCLHNKKQTNMNLQTLNPPRNDGFPKIVEISSRENQKSQKVFLFTVDPKDPVFEKPIQNKDYNEKQIGILKFKTIQKCQ